MPESTSLPSYSKPPLPLDKQAELLLIRGLEGIGKNDLVQKLANISYYRWRGYTYPYQDNSKPGSPFNVGTQWNWIESDYLFDRDLRIMVFDALERVEVSLRTQLILQSSLDHGATWYMEGSLFHNASAWEKDRRDLLEDWDKSREDFVEHHKGHYSDTEPPPAWKIFETTSLGTLSKFFENLRFDLPCRTRIAGYWGFGRHSARILSSWFHHLNLVRNICAHHGRLYNRIIKVTPLFPKKSALPWVLTWPDPNRLYASLCILTFLLDFCAPDLDFRQKMERMIRRLRPGQLPSLGFPADWLSQPLFTQRPRT